MTALASVVSFLVLTLPALGLAFLLYCAVRWALRGGKTKYRYDSCNPYRRWCSDCGQEENVYSRPLGPDRWEAVGRPSSNPCLIHKLESEL